MFAEKCFLLALIISVAGLVSAHPLSSSYSKNCLRSNGKFPKEGSLCRSYYECKKWSAREKKCSGKEHFHPAKERCVHPDEYPCFEKPPKSSKCPRENGKFLVSGTHCRKFYECCDGRPTKRKCPGDLLFDPDREACEYPELYQCVEDRNKKPKKCPKEDGKFLKPGSGCITYYVCRNGRAREKSCPYGQIFDRARRKCDWQEVVACNDDSSLVPKCLKPDGKYLKEGTNCETYYDCHDGIAQEIHCPVEQLFSIDKQGCEWEELVTCDDDGLPRRTTLKPYRTTARDSSDSSDDSSSSSSSSDESDSSKDSSSSGESGESKEILKSTTVSRYPSESTSSSTSVVSTDSTLSPPVSTSSELPRTGKDKTMIEETTTSAWTSSSQTPISTIDGDISTNEQSTASSTRTFSESSTIDPEITTEDTFETAPTSVSSISTASTPISSEMTGDLSTSHQTSTSYDSTGTSFSSVATTGQNDKTEVDITEKSSTTSVSLPSTSVQTPTVTEAVSTNEPSSTEHDQTAWPTGVPRSSALPTTRKDLEGKDTFDFSTLSPVSTTSGLPLISTEIITEHSTSYSTTDQETTRSSKWIFQTPETTIGSSENEVDGSSLSTSAISETDATSTLSESTTEIDPNVFTTVSSTDLSTLTKQTTVKEVTHPVTDGLSCPEPDGHFPHPTNRHKFIACVAGNLYVMDCADDLVFNYEKMECDYDNQ